MTGSANGSNGSSPPGLNESYYAPSVKKPAAHGESAASRQEQYQSSSSVDLSDRTIEQDTRYAPIQEQVTFSDKSSASTVAIDFKSSKSKRTQSLEFAKSHSMGLSLYLSAYDHVNLIINTLVKGGYKNLYIRKFVVKLSKGWVIDSKLAIHLMTQSFESIWEIEIGEFDRNFETQLKSLCLSDHFCKLRSLVIGKIETPEEWERLKGLATLTQHLKTLHIKKIVGTGTLPSIPSLAGAITYEEWGSDCTIC